MTDPLHVHKDEPRLVRLFALDMPPQQARFLRQPGGAAQALGVDQLDDTEAEVFDIGDLGDLGLTGYLNDGCGISRDQLDEVRLAALSGWMLLVRSRAFGGRAVTLTPQAGVRPVGVYFEAGTDWSAMPLSADSARRGSAPPRVAPRKIRAQARMIGLSLFLVVMLAIAGGLVWLLT